MNKQNLKLKKNEVIVFWEDAVIFQFNKPKNLYLRAHQGTIAKQNKNFIVIANPKEISYSKNKIIRRKLPYTFLFIPSGMILKILSEEDINKSKI